MLRFSVIRAGWRVSAGRAQLSRPVGANASHAAVPLSRSWGAAVGRVWSAVRRMRRSAWPRSLAGQFMIASLVVLVLGMLVIGSWVGQAISRGVLNRNGDLTAMYVNSILSG